MFTPLQVAPRGTRGTISGWADPNVGRAAPAEPSERPSNERTRLLASLGLAGPSRDRIDELLEHWVSRWLLLVGAPALFIVVWSAVPFSLREGDDDIYDVRFWSLWVGRCRSRADPAASRRSTRSTCSSRCRGYRACSSSIGSIRLGPPSSSASNCRATDPAVPSFGSSACRRARSST